MRSSGNGNGGNRNTGGGGSRKGGDGRGRGNHRGAGNARDDRAGGAPQRPRRPRPEERLYDVGPEGERTRGSRGAAARGGAKGGPKKPGSSQGGQGGYRGGQGGQRGQGGQGGQRGQGGYGGQGGGARRGEAGYGGPSRSREFEARIEERVRDRYADKPVIRTPKTFPGAEQEGERLQKVLARAGMGSRRACEELIEQARVEVNGEIVTEQGKRVLPKDEIKVDGLTVATQSHLFFVLNKPVGVVSTMEDPDGRQCLGDYVTNRETRLFHVGRLDTETEGVIILTNHGELAHRLTHPKYGVKKTYVAHITGPLPRDIGKKLKDGIELEDGWARADHFRVIDQVGKNYMVEVTLHEGRKHIVRRMLAEAGFPVEKLVRTAFGPIELGDQKSGWLRRLSNTEVGMLMREVGL
ncbi:pseudouridine synthase [Streptomyces sp. NPDC004244]|uniref:pseudouridine synthase n=1 Tax=Streptomyces sp. NPDC101206 TaxID=3366128 RepID=UPI003828C662